MPLGFGHSPCYLSELIGDQYPSWTHSAGLRNTRLRAQSSPCVETEDAINLTLGRPRRTMSRSIQASFAKSLSEGLMRAVLLQTILAGLT